MKVIHIAGGGDRGGAKTHIISLCAQLSKVCDLTLVSLRSGDFASGAEKAGIKTKTIYSSFTPGDYVRLIKFIRSEKPDIVHCHGAKANLAGVLVKLFCKSTIVTTVHSDYRLDYMHSFIKRNTFGRINTAALRCFDYYVTVSDLFKKMLIERGFSPNKIFTIYNGLDFDARTEPADKAEYLAACGLPYAEGDVVIGIPARLNPVKDIPTLLKAFAKAKAQNPRLKLLIGGDGEDEMKLRALSESLGISDSTAFLGWVEDVPRFFSVCNIDVLCSISESFPYSVLEGIREGCAVITSDVGGMSRLIDNGKNGYIFKPGDVDQFAEYILDLSSDAVKRKTFAAALFTKASALYSIKSMAETQLSIYKSVSELQQRKKGRDGILICGAYGRGNSGDESILKAIVDSIRSVDGIMPITVMTRKPLPTAIAREINTVYTFNVPAFLRIMRKASVFINGGGNLIQNSTSSRSLLFYLYTIKAAKKRGCRVIMYGCGIGTVSGSFCRRKTQKILDENVDIITLRDNISLDDLHSMGIKSPAVRMSADPAFSILPAAESDADYYLRRSGMDPAQKYICFSLRDWNDFSNFTVFSDAAEYAFEQYGLIPVFLPIEMPRDTAVTEKVASRLSCPHFVLDPPADASLTIALFGKMKAVCAMRLHALVFAATSGSPFFAASYDVKVDGFMQYVGREKFCRRLSGLDAEFLRSCIDASVTDDYASPVKMLRELESKNKEALQELL